MEKMLKVALILLPAVIFWGCQAEDVADFSEETRVVEVVRELDGANSQAAAEAAIRTLFNKAEMGEAFPGSRYELYTFSDEDIAELAELHRYYQNGELLTTLGRTFEAIMYIADDIPVPKMEFDAAMSMLVEDTDAALADPEEPDNALLAAIASENGNVPKIVPLYDENTVRSPVQTMLFAIWFHRKFAGLSKLPDDADPADLAPLLRAKSPPPGACEAECYKQHSKDVAQCDKLYWPEYPDEYAACILAAAEKFQQCLQDCHDQGESS